MTSREPQATPEAKNGSQTPQNPSQMVAKLHADFCGLTGRVVPLRFHERDWWELLRSPEYELDAARLGADVERIVRYLQRGIAQEKRNAGALKLRNFLQPDTFFADLAEAQVQMKAARALRERGARPEAPPLPPEQEEALRRQAAEHFGKFKEEIR